MEKILVPIDFSNITETLIKEAGRWAKLCAGEIYILYVEDPEPDFVGYKAGPETQRDSVAHDIRHHHQKLEDIEQSLKKQGLNATARMLQGPIVETILSEAKKNNSNFILIGTHGHSALHHLLVGSVTKNIIQKAACPIILVPKPNK